MIFFDHKDLGNHHLQLCPKVVKHPAYIYVSFERYAAYIPWIILLMFRCRWEDSIKMDLRKPGCEIVD
jgi:hypothetical protein